MSLAPGISPLNVANKDSVTFCLIQLGNSYSLRIPCSLHCCPFRLSPPCSWSLLVSSLEQKKTMWDKKSSGLKKTMWDNSCKFNT
ncbi:hypothetical protein EJB05_09602, partial [Eragrostis curvula]